jgi:hypothetical protein
MLHYGLLKCFIIGFIYMYKPIYFWFQSVLRSLVSEKNVMEESHCSTSLIRYVSQ